MIAPTLTANTSIKLTGLSQLNIRAIEQAMPDHVLAETATTITVQGTASEMLLRTQRWMDDFLTGELGSGAARRHPYASLHAVVRKLKKIVDAERLPEATGDEVRADAPAPAPVPTEGQEEATTGTEDAAHPAKAKLRAEVARLQADYDRLEAAMPGLQAEYDKAWERVRRHGIDRVPAKLNAECDRLSERVVDALDQQRNLKQMIDRLSNPAELERRLQDANATKERITTMAAKAKTNGSKTTARDQGFPEVYLGENGNFKPGLDASAKSDLIASAMGGKGKRHTFSEEEAKKLLKERGWVSFLNRKIEIEATKAEKAEKQEAPAEEAPAEEAAAESAAAEVKPDPKPKPAPKRRGGRIRSGARS